uniref:mechanosensitive ion channel protein 10-like n=1 Tax=Erigeron canadensis TaxID=72917 RepID=UPI001CB9BF26|nr:mechanosensitive ion channel protein 10-like [Erigeron canadensis]
MRRLYASLFDKIFSKRRIQGNLFHQYILETLSGRELSSVVAVHSCSGSNLVDPLTKMIGTSSQPGFYTLPDRLSKSKDLMIPHDEQNDNRYITTVQEAMAAGYPVFTNVAKPGHLYIEMEDLLRFMTKEELDLVLPLIGGIDESGRIEEKSFLNWVVSMYMKSKFLGHSLNDIEEAIMTLRKYVNVQLAIVLFNLWLLLMRIATIKVLMVAQLLVAVFMRFGCSFKSPLDGMIFVFLKHPFDVGDRCLIDGVQVIVEKVSIFTTVFLRYDNEKISYRNSILATKSITNFNQSPEMTDTVKVDLEASVENISALEAKIKMNANLFYFSICH